MNIVSTPIEQKKDLFAPNKLTTAQMEEVVKAGAEVSKAAIQALAEAGANHRRHQLKPSIDYEMRNTGAATYAYLGWKKEAIKGGGATRYRDANGHGRKVSTVADYGGILEYSAKRVHRHMESGFDDSEGAATDAIEQAIESLIDAAVK